MTTSAREMHPAVRTAKAILRNAGVSRSGVAELRLRAEREVLARVGRERPRTTGRILCYHSVGTPSWGVNDVSPEQFRRQVLTALASGYTFRTAEELARDGGRGNELALTFDDGLASVLEHAAPFLKAYDIPFSMFIVSDWADGRHDFEPDTFLDWRGVERLVELGGTIGSHSVTHPNFGAIGLEQARHELGESRRVIESRIGVAPSAFAIPMGTSRDWTEAAQEIAESTGYEVIYSQSECRHPAGTARRTFVTRADDDRLFRAALAGKFDRWEEWV